MKKPLVVFAALALAGCGMMGIGGGPKATADLQPTKGSKTAGKITFTQSGDKVHVSKEGAIRPI